MNIQLPQINQVFESRWDRSSQLVGAKISKQDDKYSNQDCSGHAQVGQIHKTSNLARNRSRELIVGEIEINQMRGEPCWYRSRELTTAKVSAKV